MNNYFLYNDYLISVFSHSLLQYNNSFQFISVSLLYISTAVYYESLFLWLLYFLLNFSISSLFYQMINYILFSKYENLHNSSICCVCALVSGSVFTIYFKTIKYSVIINNEISVMFPFFNFDFIHLHYYINTFSECIVTVQWLGCMNNTYFSSDYFNQLLYAITITHFHFIKFFCKIAKLQNFLVIILQYFFVVIF